MRKESTEWTEAYEARFQEAVELEKSSKVEEARAKYESMLRDIPHAMVHLNLGVIAHAQNRLPQAVFHYESAIEIHPGYKLAHFNLASLFDDLMFRYACAARNHFESALALNEDYSDAIYNYALLEGRLGHFARAIERMSKFLEIDKGDTKWHEWGRVTILYWEARKKGADHESSKHLLENKPG